MKTCFNNFETSQQQTVFIKTLTSLGIPVDYYLDYPVVEGEESCEVAEAISDFILNNY